VQRFSKAEAFPEMLYLHSEDEVRRVIDEQKALLVLRFPPDFSRRILAGEPGSIQALLDGRRSNSSQIAFSYAQNIVAGYAADRSGREPVGIQSEVVVRHAFNPNLDYKWFIVPSLVALITTLGTMIVTALSVAREREQGTFDQLLVSPLTPGMIMLGKAIPAVLIALAQGTVILAAAVFAYRIPFQGSLLFFYGSTFIYILSLVGCGLFISSLCSTQQQAFLGAFGFLVPAILLSGFAAPVENMPVWLQRIAWADPLSHFLVIVKGIFLKGMGPADVWPHAWPMLLIAVVTLAAAVIVFRRKIA
jgi:ABC-2 type transport system permease protein